MLGFGFRVLGSGCWVLGSRFWVLGSGFWVLGSGFWVLGSGCWVLGSGFWVLGSGFWVLGAWCWVLGAGFWVRGSGFWVLDVRSLFLATRISQPAPRNPQPIKNLIPLYVFLKNLLFYSFKSERVTSSFTSSHNEQKERTTNKSSYNSHWNFNYSNMHSYKITQNQKDCSSKS